MIASTWFSRKIPAPRKRKCKPLPMRQERASTVILWERSSSVWSGMPPESPANNTGKDVAARRAGCGFTVRIPCPGVLLDAPKLESSKIWTTRRPDRHPAAGGGTPHLQQSSPPGGFRKMLPNRSARLVQLSHGATTPPLCPSEFRTSYRRPNFGHWTGSLQQIVAGKSLPAPASVFV